MRRESSFDCSEGISHEGKPHVIFLWSLQYKIVMGCDHMNKATSKGKKHIGFQSTQIWKSYELKKPFVCLKKLGKLC